MPCSGDKGQSVSTRRTRPRLQTYKPTQQFSFFSYGNGLYRAQPTFSVVKEMGCWKWFGSVLKEAGVEVTDENREKVDEVIHRYIGEKSSYGRCSADWRKARKEVNADEEMRNELVEKLRSLA